MCQGFKKKDVGTFFLSSKLCQGEKMKWISIRLHQVIFKLGGGGCWKDGPKNPHVPTGWHLHNSFFLCRQPNACFGIRMFCLKRFTAGSFEVLFWKVLSWKNMTGDNVLWHKWYLLRVENISRHAHKTGSQYLLARGSFQNFWWAPLYFWLRVLPSYCTFNHPVCFHLPF